MSPQELEWSALAWSALVTIMDNWWANRQESAAA